MKNNSWPEVSLGSYTNLLTGFPFKSANYIDDPNGIRLLRGDNIVQGALRWNNCKRWTSSDIEPFSKYSLEYNDVVLAMDRPWIEAGLKWAYIKESDLPCLLVQRVTRLRGINGLLTNFIRYIISDINFTNYVKSVITGINIPHISGPQIQAYQFRLPPIKTQQKIASILSSYDDLIENNTRRIEILEQMAKLVYEEWFVKFRFPGHKNVKMIPSELGEIPEGWKVEKLGSAVELAYGKSLTAKNRTGGSFPVYGSAGVVGTHDEYMVKCPGIIVGRKGNVGSIFWSNENFFPIDTVFYVKTNVLLHYVYYNLKNQNFINNDAAVPGLNRNQAYLLPFLIPDDNILTDFEKNIDPIFKEIDILSRKNQNLRKTRDLLLPKLISGETEVSDLDIHIRNEVQEL